MQVLDNRFSSFSYNRDGDARIPATKFLFAESCQKSRTHLKKIKKLYILILV